MVLEPAMRKASSAPTQEKKAQFIKLLTEIGPQITQIGSRIGVHKETVRYWYKHLLEHGFTIRAAYNFEKLGMRRLVFVIDLDPSYVQYAQPLFVAMNQLCYVVSFRRSTPTGLYLVSASVPAEATEDYIDFMKQLKEKGIFRSVEAYNCDWIRNIPMKADNYDFDMGLWEFDWASPPASSLSPSMAFSSEKSRFDAIDLHIMQELAKDASKDLVEIRGELMKNFNLEVGYKTLEYHYRTHVRDLIKVYTVGWMGARYDFQAEKIRHRKHRYVAIDLLVRSVSEAEKVWLIQEFSRMPFQWAEAAGSDYFAQFAFPTEMLTDGMLYLEKATARVRDRVSFYMIDMAESFSLSVTPNLWNSEKKVWRFEKSVLLEKFEALKVKIKSGLG